MYSPKETIQIIQHSLNGRCIADIHRATGISCATLYRWRTETIRYPRVHTFLGLAAYFHIPVSFSNYAQRTFK